jgi:DNA-binding Lrp family transcriptional regulator
MTHITHRMHDNSLDAFREEKPKLSARAERIYGWVGGHGLSTDRDVLRGLNYSDMNQVRPRITELVEDGLFEEVDKVRCPVTHKNVRRVRVKTVVPAQMELPC